MRPAPPIRKGAAPGAAPPVVGEAGRLREAIRKLIWVYLILLVLEGALRKWALPQLSNPLLLIRDPVVLLIYALALRSRAFPWNGFMFSLLGISILSFLAGILVLEPFLPPSKFLFVTLYGYRSNFLHLPLLFVIPQVFHIEHVRKMGWWIAVGIIPTAALMAVQFQASPEHFINRTVGLGESLQITAGGGKIRPPATFSFVSGVIFYLSAGTAFLMHRALTRGMENWLLSLCGFSLLGAIAVSGSRSAVASVGLVVLSLALILFVRPDAMTRFGRLLLLAAAIAWISSFLPIMQQGVGILSDRFVESAEAAETTVAGGMIERTFSGFIEGFRVLDRIPRFGYGLGIGTNGGARFLTGRAGFLLAEGEWARVLLESGPALGIAFLLWRTLLMFYLGYRSLQSLRQGNTLPILIFSAAFLGIINGQFGQPTSLGFSVLLGGLCLAAMNAAPSAPAGPAPAPTRSSVPRRSIFAERIHQSAAVSKNGAAGR